MKDLELESPKQSTSASSSSSALSSSSRLLHHSMKQLSPACHDLDPSQRSDREPSHSRESLSACSQSSKCRTPSPPPKRETREIKISPPSNNKKGCVGFRAVAHVPHPPQRQKPRPAATATRENSQRGCVGFGAGPRGPHPPQRQKPRPAATANRENATPKNDNPATKRLFVCQELQIKRLKNVIVELQNENETLKIENRALKQAQGRLQHKKMTENKYEELRAQYAKDTQALHEQLRRYKKQLRAAEQTIKDNNLMILKEQIKGKKNEETFTHMKQLLAKKDLETREKLLRELEKERKAAQEAEDRAAEVERKAELANNLHQKLLLVEKKKSAAALEEISFLMEKVHDLNHRLMLEGKAQRNPNTAAHSVMKEITRKIKDSNAKEKDSSREAKKREESKKTSPGWSKPLHAGKTYTKTAEKTAETKKRTFGGFKPLPIVNIGTNITEEEEENEKRARCWSKPLHALKTYTKSAEKTQETKRRSLTCSKPLPIVKTGTMTTGECPLSTKPTKADKRRPNKHDEQKHEDEKEKICVKKDKKHKLTEALLTKLLAEDPPLAETTGIPSEKQLVQSSESPAGDEAVLSQTSTEGISALFSQSHTPRRSLKDVETETASVDGHNSLLDKLLGPSSGPAGDAGNLLDGCDDSRQTDISSREAASASVVHGVESPPPGPPASSD